MAGSATATSCVICSKALCGGAWEMAQLNEERLQVETSDQQCIEFERLEQVQ